MKKSIVLFIAALGIVGSSWAEQNFANEIRSPSLEEYQAAMVVVRRYLAEQRAAMTESDAGSETALDERSLPGDLDMNQEDNGSTIRTLTNPGFSVFGAANVEAATIDLFAADGNDGTVTVQNNVGNQLQSGSLVFKEGSAPDLCGFQFGYNGATNRLTLESGCPGPNSKIIFERGPGPTVFGDSIGIGGKLFDGGGTGTTTGGGFLMMSFYANGTLSCNNVCQNHAMTCDHTMIYGYGGATMNVCSHVPAGDFTWAMCACAN